jgi:uncharacterized protein (DUF433 family)
MTKSRDYKRENFDVSPEQQAEIECLQQFMQAPTRKDAVLSAVRLTLQLAAELRKGNQIYIGNERNERFTRLLMLGIEPPMAAGWKYLVEIAHPWRQQLFVKGRRLRASTVWNGMSVNKLSREEAADNWDLPVEAIDEVISYCEANKKLLEMEASEELRRLAQRGISVGSEASS